MSSLQTYRILDDELIEELAGAEDRDTWLVLEPHPDFPGQWIVQSLDQNYLFDFKDLIGSYRSLAPSKLEAFVQECNERGYKAAFSENPEKILDAYSGLSTVPEIDLDSTFPGTTNGMLPFQIQGYNFLKDLPGGVAMWSTGTGKTVLASALLKYHLQRDFDTAFFVVKSHNKINTQRTIKRLAGIDAVVIDGPRKQREIAYSRLYGRKRQVVITNYEKFRVDDHSLVPLFQDRDILCIWDEMPTKLKTRSTQLYKSVRKCLYRGNGLDPTKKRPKRIHQWMLSATPIENAPEDFYNCVRLLDPTVFGTIDDFRNQFVASYNPFNSQPYSWHNLERMGLMASHITHQVDKTDPDIAKVFPDVVEEPYFIDWNPVDRSIYDRVAKEAVKSMEDRDLFAEDTILAMIGVLQMLCNAPTMVKNSAALREAYESAMEDYWDDMITNEPYMKGSSTALKLVRELPGVLTDERHTKLDTLRSLLTEAHPGSKALVFTSFNEALLPILSKNFDAWGVAHVVYAGSSNQKQEAEDRFKEEEGIQVFLSSDAGSDSLSLEVADVVIHYDLPWKWSTLIQRQNRVHRVVSEHDAVRYYTLMMADSIEDRKMEIIAKKLGYHEAVFKGAIADQAASARMTREDLIYVLTGER